MAGIGFVLRKLASRDDFLGITRAFIHASIISAGPWLMTVCSLGLIYFFTSKVVPLEEGMTFRTVMIYNFSFSLVFSAPVYMVTTRFISDQIFLKDVHIIPGILICSMGIVLLYSLPIAVIFYLGAVTLPLLLAIQAILNFLLLSMLWVAMLFFSAVKNYQSLTIAFFLGILLATLGTIFLAFPFGAAGMLIGFNTGSAFIVFALFGVVLAEYPYRFRTSLAYFRYYRRYIDLGLACIFYNAGIWVDKWLMWFSPDAVRSPLGIPTFPTYDTAMFVAFLTIIPVMSLFVFSMETNFFETYVNFFRNLRENAPYRVLEEKQKGVASKILDNARNFIILQGSVSLMFILLAPSLFQLLGMSYLELGIFRLGVLGAFFNMLVLFAMIFLSYFDSRENYLRIALILFFSNLFFSWISREMGFVFYGYGYFFAMAFTFVISSFILINYTKNLSYQIFITNNVRRLPITDPVAKSKK
jgi:polysaccharide biosynthesis protein PelG